MLKIGACHLLYWNFTGTAPGACTTGAPEARWTRTFNGVGQVLTDTVSDAAYAWAPAQASSIAYTPNRLNQYANVGGVAVTHNANGNLTNDHRGRTYTYDAENVLRGVTGISTYRYYADGARREKTAGASSQFYYWGDQEIAEYNGAALLRRFVRLPGSVDEPFLMIDQSLPANDRERWAHQNRQGSVVALTNASGGVIER